MRDIKIFWAFPLLLALYEMVGYLSTDAYLPALPHIQVALHTSHHLVQLTLTTWFMGLTSMQLILGPLSDRIGRRPILLTGGVIFILSTIGCAFIHNIYSFLILRFIQGATITSIIVSGYSTIHELFNEKQAIHTIAIMGSITILAPAFGPLLGSVVLYFTGWRWIFSSLAILAIIIVGGLFFLMPETISKNEKKANLKTILNQYKNIFVTKKFILLAITSGCLYANMIAWLTAGPFLLFDQFHLHLFYFGILQVFVFGSLIIATLSVKRLMNYFPLNNLIWCGIMLSLSGAIYAFISSLVWPLIYWNTIISMMVIALGAGIAFPILNRLIIRSSEEPMGSRIAISTSIGGMFAMFGSAIISILYNGSLFSLNAILLLFSIIAVVCGFAVNIRKSSNKAHIIKTDSL